MWLNMWIAMIRCDVVYNRNSDYNDVIISTMAFQITGVSIVYSTVGKSPDQRKQQSSASLASVWGNHRWPAITPHKRPVTRKMFPFDDVITHVCNTSAIHIGSNKYTQWIHYQIMPRFFANSKFCQDKKNGDRVKTIKGQFKNPSILT